MCAQRDLGHLCASCGVGFRSGFMRPADVVTISGHVLCGLERFTVSGQLQVEKWGRPRPSARGIQVAGAALACLPLTVDAGERHGLPSATNVCPCLPVAAGSAQSVAVVDDIGWFFVALVAKIFGHRAPPFARRRRATGPDQSTRESTKPCFRTNRTSAVVAGSVVNPLNVSAQSRAFRSAACGEAPAP